MIQMRSMTGDDITLGMFLKSQAGWNQTEADWRRFLALEPEGCFVAEIDGRPVGTTTTSVFDSVGWIAMVLVEESARHQGIGTGLVRNAIRYLESRGVHTIRLDATPLGRPVYEHLGFVADYELVRLHGRSSPSEVDRSAVLPPTEWLQSIIELDCRISATPRERLLLRLVEEHPAAVQIAMDGRTAVAYSLFRPGSRAVQLGPAVALFPDVGRDVCDRALRQCAGQPVFIDIPRANHHALAWAASEGFIVQRALTRMHRGHVVPDKPSLIWASSGPEKG